MRKDVKFGLTIGAILVVTLVVYVIVLSRGASAPQRISLAMPNQSDQTADSNDSTDSTATPHTDNTGPAAAADDSDTSSSATGNATPPAPASVAPATQPDAAAPQSSNDWEHALNSGVPVTLAAPERTVTPTIDSSSPTAPVHNEITRPANIPMIDQLPSTQPSQPMIVEVPTLDAVPVRSGPYAAPSYTDSSVAPAGTPRSHRVAAGESPYSIAQAIYGNGKYYTKIIAANPGIDPRRLKIGQILVIPQLTDSDKPASPAAANTTETQSVNTRTAYVVRSGDSLESICMKLYGTRAGAVVNQIYQANKSLIGPDEDVLKIGWILKLPKPPTETDAQR